MSSPSNLVFQPRDDQPAASCCILSVVCVTVCLLSVCLLFDVVGVFLIVLINRKTFTMDPDTHIDSLEQAEAIVLEGTSKWSCKIAITG